MSLVLVNTIIYLDTLYKCYYDTGTHNGSVVITGSSPQTFIPFPNPENSGHEGDQVNSFCSDDPTTTLVKIFLNQTTPFFTSSLTADSPSCLPGPDPGCDLNIISLAITNETGVGLNDGTVTINASSTNGPIGYSLDNATFVAGNFFSGLAPANYTAYVNDANDCTDQQNFTVQSFSNPVQNLQDDLPVVDIGGGNISRWQAAYNPIVINYQRKDYNVTSVVQAAAPSQIKVTLDTTLTFDQYTLALTKSLYLKTALYHYYGVAAAYAEVGGFGVFTITTPFLGVDTIGFININDLKTGYHIETRIQYGLDPLDQRFITATHSPNNQTGSVRADLSSFLQTIVNARDRYNYVDQSYTDIDRASSYKVSFREVWDSDASPYFYAPDPLYVVNSAFQLGERYGGNMAEYVPFETVVSDDQLAKFLTDWQKPIFWGGLPFELSFIYSENVINQQLYIELNADCGGGNFDGLLLNADASYLLDTDSGRFVIQRLYNPLISGYPIIQALGLTRILIPDVFDCCANEITARVYYENTGAPSVFTWSLDEDNDPVNFVDGDIKIIDRGTQVLYSQVDGTGTVNIMPGHPYTIIAQTLVDPGGGADPTLTLTVAKNAVLLFAQTIPSVQNATISYSGIAGIGDAYDVQVIARHGGEVTPSDNPDDTPVTITKKYVSQTLPIRYICPCDDPYIYLKWLNSKGGWDYYRFGFNQQEQANVSNDQAVKRFVFDWANDDTLEDVINKSAITSITVGADNIDKDAANVLQWARKSIHAMILVNKNPIKWHTVVIRDGDTSPIQSRKLKANVSLQLLLPSTNIQQQ